MQELSKRFGQLLINRIQLKTGAVWGIPATPKRIYCSKRSVQAAVPYFSAPMTRLPAHCVTPKW